MWVPGNIPEVSVKLYPYGLTFFIKSHGELESRNLCDQLACIVTEVQMPRSSEDACSMLIPKGDVSFSRDDQVLVGIRAHISE